MSENAAQERVLDSPDSVEPYDAKAEGQRRIEELYKRTEEVYQNLNLDNPDEEAQGVLDDAERRTHQLALARLESDDTIPKVFQIERDQNDTEAQHEEKQTKHKQLAADIIAARLANSEIAQKQPEKQAAAKQEANRAPVSLGVEQVGAKNTELFTVPDWNPGKTDPDQVPDWMPAKSDSKEPKPVRDAELLFSFFDDEELEPKSGGSFFDDNEDLGSEDGENLLIISLQDYRKRFSERFLKAKAMLGSKTGAIVYEAKEYFDKDGSKRRKILGAVAGGMALANSSPTISVKGVTERSGRRFRNAKAALLSKATTAAYETKGYFTDQEKGKHRRTILGVVAGGIALGLAAAYLSNKTGLNIMDGGSGKSGSLNELPKPSSTNGADQLTATPPKGSGTDQLGQHLQKDGTTGTGGIERHNVVEHLNEKNWTPSHIAQSALQKEGFEANNDNIYKLTDYLLEKQGLSDEDARHLADGHGFSIPPREVIEEILNK